MNSSVLTGDMCQFVGQFVSSSTKEKPRPSTWFCMAFLMPAFALRMFAGLFSENLATYTGASSSFMSSHILSG